MWTLMPQSQHCGAQLHARKRGADSSGAPAEAAEDRAAQDHEQAGIDAPGRPPASRLEDDGGKGDLTFASTPRPSWSDETQGERAENRAKRPPDDLPLPEGK